MRDERNVPCIGGVLDTNIRQNSTKKRQNTIINVTVNLRGLAGEILEDTQKNGFWPVDRQLGI